MNLYLRYFDSEVFAYSIDEAFDFLQSIPEVDLDEFLMSDIVQYVESNNMYPKRYKVHGKAYFIIIKTTASCMEEFKSNGALAHDDVPKTKVDVFSEFNPGWYDGSIMFKRVIPIPQTQKFQYVDTFFVARVKALSKLDCYNKIIDHLRSRNDIDSRSQFPSIKGRNFECVFHGMDIE
ncbi:MAG: hypothetical protein J6W52_02510 [Bacteroidaceae bacterium]|nr:hypothetical protein [Bacteroidaceae bacterium]